MSLLRSSLLLASGHNLRDNDHIVITVVFAGLPGGQLLDTAGAAQVFRAAADIGAPLTVRLALPASAGPSSGDDGWVGFPLDRAPDWPVPGPDDVLVVPGWRAPVVGGPLAAQADPDPAGPDAATAGPWQDAEFETVLDLLRRHRAAGGLSVGVGPGVFALAEAGLLDGRRCTTSPHLYVALGHAHPRAKVLTDVRFVADQVAATAAGGVSGLELALSLVTQRFGDAVAARVVRALHLPVRGDGRSPLEGVMVQHRDHANDLAHRVQDVVEAEFTSRLPLNDLARRAGVSERTLTRAFVQATGLTPLRYQQMLRLGRAEELVAGGVTMEAAARAVGFEDARMLRRLRAAGRR